MRWPATWCVLAQVGLGVSAGCGSSNRSAPVPSPEIATVSPQSGSTSGGTVVTIAGANFISGTTVQFGNTPATDVTLNGPTSLSAVTPPKPEGMVGVTVTNPDGQSAVLPSGFTYVAPVACPIPANITADTTLDPSCVWTATETVFVGGPLSPVLTILPGTTVVFVPNPNGLPATALQVGVTQPGALVANGTSTAGIAFTSAAASPDAGDWGGIVIGSQSGGTSITYATIAYAGGPGANEITDDAALTVEGGDVLGGSQSPAPTLANLIIDNSAAHGLLFAGLTTGFGQNSANIQINNWDISAHFPLVIEANEAGTIPTTISAKPASGPTSVVALNSYILGSCNIKSSTTWPALAQLPYLALMSVELSALSAGDPPVTLTITPGTTIEFASGAALDVDPNFFGNAFLQANGTNSSQITLTSNQAKPSTGAWGGVNFWCVGNDQLTGSSLSYASIQWATSIYFTPNNHTGEITILNATSSPNGLQGPKIANCTLGDYADYGITMVDVENTTYDSYVSNNTFSTSSNVLLDCTGQITDGSCTSEPPQ
jgi:IPT/TIG domain